MGGGEERVEERIVHCRRRGKVNRPSQFSGKTDGTQALRQHTQYACMHIHCVCIH